jgi:hypothetical protein
VFNQRQINVALGNKSRHHFDCSFFKERFAYVPRLDFAGNQSIEVFHSRCDVLHATGQGEDHYKQSWDFHFFGLRYGLQAIGLAWVPLIDYQLQSYNLTWLDFAPGLNIWKKRQLFRSSAGSDIKKAGVA